MSAIFKVLTFTLLVCLSVALSISSLVFILSLMSIQDLSSAFIIPLYLIFSVSFFFSIAPTLAGGVFLYWAGKKMLPKKFRLYCWVSGIALGISILILFSSFRGTSEVGGAMNLNSFYFFALPFLLSLLSWVHLGQRLFSGQRTLER
jgi:amino acid transporter